MHYSLTLTTNRTLPTPKGVGSVQHPAFPVICFDEVPYQLVSETKDPLSVQNGKPLGYDYEYRREGTCNLFMFLQPLVGWRHVKVTDHRTKPDFAECMKDLVEIHIPQAEKIRVVLVNLNTHSPAAFYEAFPPEQARQLTKKLEFHYTSEHSSWLKMAEVEISVLTEQWLDRRLGSEKNRGTRSWRLGSRTEYRQSYDRLAFHNPECQG